MGFVLLASGLVDDPGDLLVPLGLLARYGEDALWWSGLALAGAALFAGLALLTARWRALSATAPLAAASVLFSSFAVTLEIGRGWPGVGLALAVPFLVWLFPKFPPPALRSLAPGLAALSVLWLGLSGEEFGYPDGGALDFPWLLYGYGAPLLALFMAIWLARRQGDKRVADRLEWAAVGLALLLVIFSVRQLHPETGTDILVLFGLGIVLAFGIYRAYRGPKGWEPRPATVRVLLFAVVLGAAGTAAGQDRLYTRPIDVAARGWVRVPFDLAMLRHLGAEGEGVRVFGPDGQEVPSRMEPLLRETERSFNSARVLDRGWDKKDVVVEIAPGETPPFDQILFSSGTGEFGAAPGLLPEGSEDGKIWRPLGVSADFFEVWRGDGVAGDRQGSLLLPPGPPRFLRFTLPLSLRWAEVLSLPARTLAFTVERPECRREGETAVCSLRLPARHQRPLRFVFELADRNDVGVRLFAVEAGVLQPLAQGVSRPAPGGSRHVVPLALVRPLETRTLRLELRGKGAPPRIVRTTLTLAQPAAVFEAPGPGRYSLHSGDGGGLGIDESIQAFDEVWIEPGPESSREMSPLAARLVHPTDRLTGTFESSWTVEPGGASPGDVARLEIPEEVYARSRAGLADVRLEAGGRQIPYVRRSLDEPARVVEVRGAHLEKSFLGGLRLDIPLPQPRLPLTTYRLTAPPDVKEFRQWPSLSLTRIGRASEWLCFSHPLLPCQLNGPATIEEDRPFAPVVWLEHLRIPKLDVAVWRRRDAFVFVWPDGGPVRLVAGDRERGAPGYDLARIEPRILARSWHPASLGPREAAVSWLRLPLAVLAGGVLLVFLRRKLPVAPPPGQG